MEIAKIRVKVKKGDRYESSNYRPISILSVFSKILEKLIYHRFILFINKHNILTDARHGFRNNKSDETASQLFIENIQESVDKQLYILGLFFFDLV